MGYCVAILNTVVINSIALRRLAVQMKNRKIYVMHECHTLFYLNAIYHIRVNKVHSVCYKFLVLF